MGLAALLASQRSQAADHLDSPGVATPSPTADINDVYTWMDGSNLVLAMSVSPGDMDSRTFGPDVQYVFHVHSKEQLGLDVPGVGSETRVLCTFESNTSAQCWVTQGGTVKDYIAGDPSEPAGAVRQNTTIGIWASTHAAT
jgi:hypothetical protein